MTSRSPAIGWKAELTRVSGRSSEPRQLARLPSAALVWGSIVVAGIPSTAQDEQRRPIPPSEIAPEWGVVGQSGPLRTLFIAADGLKDRLFVVQVLRRVVEKAPSAQALEVLIFDDRRFTPPGRPSRPQELSHLRARYVRDPVAKMERFVWVSIEDVHARPLKLKETEAAIGVEQPGT
jgi:hypothetical protein